MKTIQTAIKTMAITLMVIVGMTGLAMADSTIATYTGDGSYDMDFSGAGTGSMQINTFTGDGSDFQHAEWSNAEIDGYQYMAPGTTWTEIDRTTTITGTVNGAIASGFTATQTTDNSGDLLTAYAGYHDDDAYGSCVTLGQDVYVGTISGLENGVGSFTYIGGYAYGADTQVVGQVKAVSNGQYNVGVSASIDMSEGKMSMGVGIGAATISGSDEVAGMDVYMHGDGDGVANINGHSTCQATADFNFGVTNDGLDYYPENGDLYGNPVSVNLFDDFDTNYDATGYIYVVTP